MSQSTLPPGSPPVVGVSDHDDEPRRQRFVQWQIMITTITLFVTAWFCTLGTIPAIIALLVAKHILVANLVMGLGVNAPRTSSLRAR